MYVKIYSFGCESLDIIKQKPPNLKLDFFNRSSNFLFTLRLLLQETQ